MTEQKKLKELANNVKIVGTLKEVNLEVKPNKKDPTVLQIMGDIVVLVEDKKNNRVNEHTVQLFAKKSSKLFKGYDTIRTAFKSITTHGKELADRVSVTGSVNENMYVPQDGKLRQFNRLRGLFVNRVDEKALAKEPGLAQDYAMAQIEIVVENVLPKTDKDGIETGEYTIEGFSVGYGDTVSKIHDIVVGTDLADTITEHYEPGATGKLTFAINNYVEAAEEEEEADPFGGDEGGFGVQVDISEGPVGNYVRELRVIGGFPPYLDERALDEDDINLAKQIHALKVQETVNAAPPAAPPASTTGGFGTTNVDADPFAAGQGPIEISDDDLPF